MIHASRFFHQLPLAAALAAGFFSLSALAADAPKGKAGSEAAAAAQAQYKRDLADCDSRPTEDRALCRTEAGRAYAEVKRNGFADLSTQYKANATQRCEALKGIDRTACEQRMNGAGSVQGSVAGGGLLRENSIIVPAK
jgi:hypothetical protein